MNPNLRYTISRVTSDSPFFFIAVETIKEGKQYTLKITTRPPLPEGRKRGSVHVFSEDPSCPQLNIPVIIDAFGDLIVSHNRIIINPETFREHNGRFSIMIIPGTTKRFEILDVVPPPSIISKVSRVGLRAYRIDLIIPKLDQQLDGKCLLIRTDVAEKREIRVPFVIQESTDISSVTK